MWRLTGIALFAIGIIIAQSGIGEEFLLPGDTPGLKLLNLSIVGFGLALSGAAALLRPGHFREDSPSPRRRLLAAASLVTLFTLVALEITLWAMGMPTYFPQTMPDTDYRVVSWITCDEDGCRMNYEEVVAQCAAGQLSGRLCIVNRQGYPNLHDFEEHPADDERIRIVTAGDSFTHGSTADIGQSYVEYLKAAFPSADIWNIGIGGTGTVHTLKSYNRIAPSFNPQLTTLGFSMNDFEDNLMWAFLGVQVLDSDGNVHLPRYRQRDRWGNPLQLPQDLVLPFAVLGYKPPTSPLEARVGTTRLGTLALRVLDRAGEMVFDRSFEAKVETTRQYLEELRDAVLALDSGFLVLLIPALEDIGNPGKEMAGAIKLMEELDIPYLNPISLLTKEDYVPQPDGHWNNEGHQKIGALLTKCVQQFIDSGSLDDCDRLNTP